MKEMLEYGQRKLEESHKKICLVENNWKNKCQEYQELTQCYHQLEKDREEARRKWVRQLEES